jgi:Domain of unknown function (DUF5122) beta-propeller
MKFYAPFSHRVLGLLISILFFASFVFAVEGDVDTSFFASAVRTNDKTFSTQTKAVKSIKQPDGKIIITGDFAAVGKYSRKGLARFNADGTVDSTFIRLRLTQFLQPLPGSDFNPTVKFWSAEILRE